MGLRLRLGLWLGFRLGLWLPIFAFRIFIILAFEIAIVRAFIAETIHTCTTILGCTFSTYLKNTFPNTVTTIIE